MFKDYQTRIYGLAHVYVRRKATKTAKVDYHYFAILEKTAKTVM